MVHSVINAIPNLSPRSSTEEGSRTLTSADENRRFRFDDAPGITGSRSLGEGEWKLRAPGASAMLGPIGGAGFRIGGPGYP